MLTLMITLLILMRCGSWEAAFWMQSRRSVRPQPMSEGGGRCQLGELSAPNSSDWASAKRANTLLFFMLNSLPPLLLLVGHRNRKVWRKEARVRGSTEDTSAISAQVQKLSSSQPRVCVISHHIVLEKRKREKEKEERKTFILGLAQQQQLLKHQGDHCELLTLLAWLNTKPVFCKHQVWTDSKPIFKSK